MSNPRREALVMPNHLVVRTFLTETRTSPTWCCRDRVARAELYAPTRPYRAAVARLDPPGDARPDLWIINELARRMGLDWDYSHPRHVFNEMRQCMDSIAGITWDRLERESSVTYPCEKEGDPGQPVVFVESFPTTTGRATFVPANSLHVGTPGRVSISSSLVP